MSIDFIILTALITGIISLLLPIYSIFFNKKISTQKIAITTISFFACAISIFLALIYCYYLIKNNDIASLEDTISGLIFGGSILLVSSLILNSSLLLKYKNSSV